MGRLGVKVYAAWRGSRASVIAAFCSTPDALAYAKLVIEQKRFSSADCRSLRIVSGRTLLSELFVPGVSS